VAVLLLVAALLTVCGRHLLLLTVVAPLQPVPGLRDRFCGRSWNGATSGSRAIGAVIMVLFGDGLLRWCSHGESLRQGVAAMLLMGVIALLS